MTWQTKVFVAATLISRPDARVEHAVGVAGRLRAHDVRHREDGRAALACETHRRERVGRLARLRDADDEVAGTDHRVAVAVLRGDVHLDGQARPLLDGVATHQTGVVARAAGDDDDALRVAQDVLVDVVGQVDPVRADRAARDRLGDRVGLLVDLLEHERLVAGLLGRLLVPVDLGDLAVDRLASRRHERDALGAHDDDLAVLDDLDLARLGEEGRDRGGDELLAVAAADHQRALLAGADEDVGVVEAHRDEREVALELGVGGADGLLERAERHVVRDQVGDDLGVGVRGEDGALVHQAGLEGQVVLDDAVHDDVHAVGGVGVRVGVALRHAAVRGPARVADAGARGVRGGDGRAGADGELLLRRRRRAGWRGCRPRAPTRERHRSRPRCRPSRSRDTPASGGRRAADRAPAVVLRSQRCRTWVS